MEGEKKEWMDHKTHTFIFNTLNTIGKSLMRWFLKHLGRIYLLFRFPTPLASKGDNTTYSPSEFITPIKRRKIKIKIDYLGFNSNN
jgi:hypothetical protein